MLPNSSFFYSTNSGDRYAIFHRYFFILAQIRSYIQNFVCRKYGLVMTLTNRAIAAIFTKHINHIISVRANKEMGRVYTRRIIARMTNKFSIWDMPLIDSIGYAMCWFHIAAANTKLAIAFMVATALPNPTAINCFFKEAFKSLKKSPAFKMMSLNESYRHTPYMTERGIRLFCWSCGLTAATLTKFYIHKSNIQNNGRIVKEAAWHYQY